jgi:hypothetical protein
MTRRSVVPAALALWAAALSAGFASLWRHTETAGAAPVTPQKRLTVDDARLLLAAGTLPPRPAGAGMTLLVFAHPHCPCTRATLAELSRLLAACQGLPAAPRVLVVFVRPAGAAPGWERTETWEAASRLPGVTVLADADAKIARRFDAKTSGQVFLYDGAGRLRFCGGITGGRGHEGDNAGRDAVTAALVRGTGRTEQTGTDGDGNEKAGGSGGADSDPPVVAQRTPVFGCALY